MPKIALMSHIYSIHFDLAASLAIVAETSLLIITDLWPPYAIAENGEHKGADVDITIATFKRMGAPIKLEFYPWERCRTMVEHNHWKVLLRKSILNIHFH